ncbi:DUF3455 domain-containing protein [Actinoplanes sp. NPDC051494]|uniref:DUF3455 domain-containing protein n=1 Tax=Actinoplanes sp. NPDC051494 TaxID=3363907 RepID=UPI0037933E18
MTTRTVKISAGVGAVALALVAVTTGASFAGETPAPRAALAPADSFLGGAPTVPATLVPPAGNVLTSVFKAKGVQVYGCGTGTWTLTEPAATLAGLNLKPLRPATALHFRGPSWESDEDGTLVEGTAPVSAPSATPNSIPQLLVTAKLTRGTGVFGGVTFIQRLDTAGGTAPTTACAAGDTTAVPYKAVYRFFKKS